METRMEMEWGGVELTKISKAGWEWLFGNLRTEQENALQVSSADHYMERAISFLVLAILVAIVAAATRSRWRLEDKLPYPIETGIYLLVLRHFLSRKFDGIV